MKSQSGPELDGLNLNVTSETILIPMNSQYVDQLGQNNELVHDQSEN